MECLIDEEHLFNVSSFSFPPTSFQLLFDLWIVFLAAGAPCLALPRLLSPAPQKILLGFAKRVAKHAFSPPAVLLLCCRQKFQVDNGYKRSSTSGRATTSSTRGCTSATREGGYSPHWQSKYRTWKQKKKLKFVTPQNKWIERLFSDNCLFWFFLLSFLIFFADFSDFFLIAESWLSAEYFELVLYNYEKNKLHIVWLFSI